MLTGDDADRMESFIFKYSNNTIPGNGILITFIKYVVAINIHIDFILYLTALSSLSRNTP